MKGETSSTAQTKTAEFAKLIRRGIFVLHAARRAYEHRKFIGKFRQMTVQESHTFAVLGEYSRRIGSTRLRRGQI
ncbi:MAG TPA: hypothetical protein VGG36_08680 [Rhizomicrobium sp.]|jgi:hypothetical protein